ncbi:hypothetical protein T492DRAFT_583889, partial [Pavlovales sp. CCMP2436]
MEEESAESATGEGRVRGMARFLGFAETDVELLWIAREALEAPLPAGWASAVDDLGNTYFHHTLSAETSWESP